MKDVIHQQQNGRVVAPPPVIDTYVDLRGQLPIRKGVDPYPRRNLGAVNGIDLHYTAGPPSQTPIAVALYQVGPGAQDPFPGIAYHFFVDGFGQVYYVQDLGLRVWHNGGPGRNDTKIGIVYTGLTQPNAEQIRGLRRAIRICKKLMGRDLSISGHKDTYPTSCPGPAWPAWREDVM